MKSVEVKQLSLYEVETSALQLTHSALGKELAESWQIPPRLIEPIAYHHTPKSSDLDPELANFVHIGDACARKPGVRERGDPLTPAIDDFVIEPLAVEGEDLLKWEDEMATTIENDMSFFVGIS